MAVAYLMEFPAEHNIFPRDVAPPFAFLDTVMVDEVMRFDQIAPLLDLDESTLARLNPCTAWTLFLPQKNIGQSCCPRWRSRHF